MILFLSTLLDHCLHSLGHALLSQGIKRVETRDRREGVKDRKADQYSKREKVTMKDRRKIKSVLD